MTVIGNKAVVGGLITDNPSNPTFVGYGVQFYIIDNGDPGNNPTPDKVSGNEISSPDEFAPGFPTHCGAPISTFTGYTDLLGGDVSIVNPAGAAPASPFVGTWWAIDSGDGSLQQLTFGAGGTMFYRDSSAFVCGGGVGFSMDTGFVNGNTWTGSNPPPPFVCPGGTSVPNLQFIFTLTEDGSLAGTYGTWTRVRP